LPVTKGYEQINVAAEEPDPDSLLNCFKRLLHLRSDHPALNAGTFSFLNLKGAPSPLLAYERATSGGNDAETLQVFLNFGKKPITFAAPHPVEKILFSTHQNPGSHQGSKVTLAPFEGIVVQK
jgi:glycosidase